MVRMGMTWARAAAGRRQATRAADNQDGDRDCQRGAVTPRRESYREAGKTKNRTLANLSRWPAERIEQLRAVLRGDKLLPAAEATEIVRAPPHGHVLAALGTARRLALDAVLPRRAPQRRRDLARP
jgi:hypothetical protein